jgi:hypothetical protein
MESNRLHDGIGRGHASRRPRRIGQRSVSSGSDQSRSAIHRCAATGPSSICAMRSGRAIRIGTLARIVGTQLWVLRPRTSDRGKVIRRIQIAAEIAEEIASLEQQRALATASVAKVLELAKSPNFSTKRKRRPNSVGWSKQCHRTARSIAEVSVLLTVKHSTCSFERTKQEIGGESAIRACSQRASRVAE